MYRQFDSVSELVSECGVCVFEVDGDGQDSTLMHAKLSQVLLQARRVCHSRIFFLEVGHSYITMGLVLPHAL